VNGLKYNINVWGLEKSGREQILNYFHNYKCSIYDFSYHNIKTHEDGYDVLVIRDIWNWMADYINFLDESNTLDKYNPLYKDDPYAHLIDGPRYLDIKYLYPLYYKHVEMYNNNPKGLIIILFNKWVSDEKYRKEIVFKTRFEYIETEPDLSMLDRWKKFRYSTAFWQHLLNCPDAVNLSKKIFGRLKKK